MNLEERSFENLVHFYEEELMRIHRGENISDLLTSVASRTLLKYGVTVRRGHPRAFLSPKTLKVLGLEEIQ